MTRGPTPLLLAIAIAAAAGCAASPRPTATTTSFRTVLEATGPISATGSLSLTADKTAYERGETIALSLENRGAITYGRDTEGCHQPVSVWLRDAAGATYFLRSGVRRECESSRAPIEPGASSTIAELDSAMVWLDRTEADKLYRLPAPLPAGSYTIHASLPVGELVTRIVVR